MSSMVKENFKLEVPDEEEYKRKEHEYYQNWRRIEELGGHKMIRNRQSYPSTRMKWWNEHTNRFIPLKTDWKWENDGCVAGRLLESIHLSQPESSSIAGWLLKLSYLPLHKFPSKSGQTSCKTCITLPRPVLLSSVRSQGSKSSRKCVQCRYLYNRFGHSKSQHIRSDTIGNSMSRDNSPDSTMADILGGDTDIDSMRLRLFHTWLQDCDVYHQCSPESSTLPTRVIDVRRETVSLYCSTEGEKGRYVALSHRWSIEKNACTFPCNIGARGARMEASQLPKRFQDAIALTRELGIPFLWIDSICIIQRHKHGATDCLSPDTCLESNDWDTERDKMEKYFGSAFLTVAATSVTHEQVDEGFLNRPFLAQSEDSEFAIDDFYRDVENASLNRRGWVLQERALSRRTIHFTSVQAYWECGHGVRCESLTKMVNETSQYLSDPEFPQYVIKQWDTNRIRLFQHLFERYSESSLTVATDRPVAIDGLVQRLARTFDTRCRYGVFEKYFHRCLLWRRSQESLKPISPTHQQKTPSWSWMAYDGAIRFVEIEPGKVWWNAEVRIDFEVRGTETSVLVGGARDLNWNEVDERLSKLFFDREESPPGQCLRYIILGQRESPVFNSPYYYVLLISPLEYGSGVDHERVGIGHLVQRCLPETSLTTVRVI